MSYTIYTDCITDEKLLELHCDEDREIIIPGMLFGVKSKRERVYLSLLHCGILSQKEYDEKMVGYEDDEDDKARLDLLDNYGLCELENLTEDQLEKYLELYTERMNCLRPGGLSAIEPKMGELKDYLIRNFSHLTPYTGESFYLAEDGDLPHGSIVFADTLASPDPPTFLYLEFGLFADTVQLDSEEEEEEDEEEEDEEEEDEACSSYSDPDQEEEDEASGSHSSQEDDNANKASDEI